MLKKTTTFVLNMSLVALLGLTIVSCEESSDTPTTKGSYVVALRTQGASGTSDYLLTHDTIDNQNSVISATGKGIEQLGWCYFASVGKTVFSFSYGTANKGIAYELNESGQLVEKGSFAYERLDCMGNDGENTIIGVGAPWGGGSYDCEIQLIDAQSVGIAARKTTPIYRLNDNDTLNKWPTSIIVQNGKMYLSFYPLHGSIWVTPQTDTAYVAVLSYPALEPITIIKDTRTGPIGYYGSSPAMTTDENGNIYTVSSGSLAAGFTQATKPSGILRIKNGTNTFDNDFFIDVESATGGAKLLTATYAGNGKIVGRVVVPGADSVMWGAFDVANSICKIVVVDVNTKTITTVNDVPLHGGEYATHALVEDGLVYMSITSSELGESRVYAINPQTATATKGAKIEGIEAPAIYNLK